MILFHMFRVLYLTKLIFRFNVKNIDISFICVLDSIHILYASKEFKYLVLYLYKFEKIQISISKFVFWKIPILC